MENIHRQQAEKEAAEERMRQEYDSLTPEIKKVIQTGDEFVKQIREANKAIPGEEISAKISHMEMLVDKIFDPCRAESGISGRYQKADGVLSSDYDQITPGISGSGCTAGAGGKYHFFSKRRLRRRWIL